MKPIESILVPVALDSDDDVALEYALHLARSLSARIDVLHVADTPQLFHADLRAVPGPGGTTMTLGECLIHEAETRLKEREARWRSHAFPIHSATVRVGHPAEVILEVAEQGHYDLIVMGRHSGGQSRFFIGGVTEKVVRHAPCAVLRLPVPSSR